MLAKNSLLKQNFLQKIYLKIKKYLAWQLLIFFILAMVGLAAVILGLSILIQAARAPCFTSDYPDENSSDAQKKDPIATALLPDHNLIYVDLGGAVKQPGIYQLPKDSRLATAVEQAGGFSSSAAQQYILQELNLAKKLTDGEKIYFPTQEEIEFQQTAIEFCQKYANSASSSQTSGSQSSNSESPGSQSPSAAINPDNSLISINQASESQLQSLTGIGEVRAQAIIAARPYQNIEELVLKEILTQKIFDNIKSQLKP